MPASIASIFDRTETRLGHTDHNGRKSDLLDFPLEWIFAFGLYLLCLLWMPFTHLIFPPQWQICCGYFILFLLLKASCTRFLTLPVAFLKHHAFFQTVFLGCEYVILCRSIGDSLCVLSYLCCAWGYPLADQTLRQFDQMLGFDWIRVFHWSVSNPLVHYSLIRAYNSLVFQLIFFSVWFASRNQKERLREIFWMMFCTLFSIIIISGFLPALGPASASGVISSYSAVHFEDLLNVIRIHSATDSPVFIANLGGIVVFPSFHTAAALLYIYAFRKSGALSAIVLLLNTGMLLSTPVFGDHYFVDMVAGGFITLIFICGIRLFFRAMGTQ